MFLYDRDIAVSTSDLSDNRLLMQGEISSNWSVNNVPNGGYLMGMIANAMMQHSNKNGTPLITANYISRCEPGNAEIEIERVTSSKQFDRLQARLFQNGKERIRALGTFVNEPDHLTDTRYEQNPPELKPREDCYRMPSFSGQYSIFENLDIRLDPSCSGWLNGKLTDISEHKGWSRFSDNRSHDVYGILLLADSFPPPVFVSQGMVAWVPTIEFSVNIRCVPKTRWLKSIFRTRYVTNGLLEEDGEVWDEHGNLVAISRQIAQYKKTG